MGHDQVREEAKVLCCALRLAARLGDWQAGVEALQFGEFRVLGLHRIRDFVQDAGADAGQHPGPWTVIECLFRRGDCAVDVFLLAGRRPQIDLV